MNGVDTYKKIKQMCPDTVVIMMTGYSVEELINDALEEGAFGIMYKPLDAERLMQMLDAAMAEARGELIMLADTDMDTICLLRETFEKKGYNVVYVNDGREALSFARTLETNILFVNMELPFLNGVELYLNLKKSKASIIVIVMFSPEVDGEKLARQALSEGVYACIPKPIDPEKALALIEEVVRNKHQHT